jgi:hypothetical protein
MSPNSQLLQAPIRQATAVLSDPRPKPEVTGRRAPELRRGNVRMPGGSQAGCNGCRGGNPCPCTRRRGSPEQTSTLPQKAQAVQAPWGGKVPLTSRAGAPFFVKDGLP